MSGARWRSVAVSALVLSAACVTAASAAPAEIVFEQLGDDLPGGPFTALSADGGRLAVASPSYFHAGEPGVVRVFEWSGTGWAQMGDDLDAAQPDDRFGWAVDMSGSGDRVAVGAPEHPGAGTTRLGGQVRVLGWDGSGWNQLGGDIAGDDASLGSGNDVDLSADGRRLAVAGYEQVRVFDWDGSDWVQTGGPMSGGERGIAMSDDGQRVAVGPVGGTGPVRVFDWDGSAWVPAGSPLGGDSSLFNCCGTPAMSSDGNRVTIASEDPVTFTFDWNGDDWVRAGENIVEWEVAMSGDGARLASADPAAIRDWDGSNWSDPAPLPAGGRFAALSRDGSVVAAGTDGSLVRTFRMSLAAPPTSVPTTTTPATTTPTTTEPPMTTQPTTVPTTVAPVASTLPETGGSAGALGSMAVVVLSIGIGLALLARRS